MPTNSQFSNSDVALVRAAAVAVYGSHWRRPLAASVGYSGSLVHAVDVGTRRLTDDLRAALGSWAVREAAAEVERHRERIAALGQLRARFDGNN